MASEEREVRLRPEYAGLYPEVAADSWMSARTVAEAVVRLAGAARRLSIYRRTLDPKHFEFRGATLEQRSGAARTRSTDARRQRMKD